MTHNGLVLDERAEKVALLRLNRPKVRNALNLAMIETLLARLEEVKGDSGVNVVVLGSVDPVVFSAGMDVTEVQGGNLETDDRLYDLQWELESFPKPVVGALGGYVFGGGAELALSVDIRVGAPNTKVCFPATAYGLAQGSWHLIEAVGWGRAKELVLTGRVVGADEALVLGLLHEVHMDPAKRAMEIALSLTDRSSTALRTVKKLFLEAGGRSVEERFRVESEYNRHALRGPEVLGRMSRRRASTQAAARANTEVEGNRG